MGKGVVLLKRIILLLAAVLAVTAMAVPAAFAAEDETGVIYCLDGQTVTLPMELEFSGGGSRTLTVEIADLAINDFGGLFYFGKLAGVGSLVFLFTNDSSQAEQFLEPGYEVHGIGAGACTSPFVPMPARIAVCSPQLMLRGNGTMGTYHDIPIAQWLDPESPYHGMPAAKFAKGGPVNGTTCDNLPGYTATGRLVDGSGLQQGGHGQAYAEYAFNS